MTATLTLQAGATAQDRDITEVVTRERPRLRSFIRRRVPDAGDAEDILQEVWFELVEATRLLQPIEQVGAWLFRVARNRITDRFRRDAVRGAAMSLPGQDAAEEEPGEAASASIEELLPAPEAGPDALYARRVLLEELDAAIDELPAAQREVFLAHEIEGKSFQQMARETGLSINTLLARKRYAVRHLRERLRAIHQQINDDEGA
jgi:RNA polymerase sigma factor (sigma-70 family)